MARGILLTAVLITLGVLSCSSAPPPSKVTILLPDKFKGDFKIQADMCLSDDPVKDGRLQIVVPEDGSAPVSPPDLLRLERSQDIRFRSFDGRPIPSVGIFGPHPRGRYVQFAWQTAMMGDGWGSEFGPGDESISDYFRGHVGSG